MILQNKLHSFPFRSVHCLSLSFDQLDAASVVYCFVYCAGLHEQADVLNIYILSLFTEIIFLPLPKLDVVMM